MRALPAAETPPETVAIVREISLKNQKGRDFFAKGREKLFRLLLVGIAVSKIRSTLPSRNSDPSTLVRGRSLIREKGRNVTAVVKLSNNYYIIGRWIIKK